MSKPERFNLSKLPREPRYDPAAGKPIPRLNGYRCTKDRHLTITVDVDVGVTPFCMGCRKCGADAHSMMYPTKGDIPPLSAATHEWYRPDEEELKGLCEANIEHVKRGGLLLRKRTDRKPIYHAT